MIAIDIHENPGKFIDSITPMSLQELQELREKTKSIAEKAMIDKVAFRGQIEWLKVRELKEFRPKRNHWRKYVKKCIATCEDRTIIHREKAEALLKLARSLGMSEEESELIEIISEIPATEEEMFAYTKIREWKLVRIVDNIAYRVGCPK